MAGCFHMLINWCWKAGVLMLILLPNANGIMETGVETTQPTMEVTTIYGTLRDETTQPFDTPAQTSSVETPNSKMEDTTATEHDTTRDETSEYFDISAQPETIIEIITIPKIEHTTEDGTTRDQTSEPFVTSTLPGTISVEMTTNPTVEHTTEYGPTKDQTLKPFVTSTLPEKISVEMTTNPTIEHSTEDGTTRDQTSEPFLTSTQPETMRVEMTTNPTIEQSTEDGTTRDQTSEPFVTSTQPETMSVETTNPAVKDTTEDGTIRDKTSVPCVTLTQPETMTEKTNPTVEHTTEDDATRDETSESFVTSTQPEALDGFPFLLEFISRPGDVTAEEEQTVRIFCLTNDHEATYYWFKGDKQLFNGDTRDEIVVISSSLIIRHVNEADSGTYTCVARNSRGQEVQASAQLTVISLEFKPSTPIFLERPVDTELVQGEILILPCRVDDPSAVITWYKDEILIEEGVFRNVFLADSNRLVITNTNFGHQGIYKCVASNQENVQEEASALLAFPNRHIFDTQPVDASVLIGEDHILRCSTQNPTLTIRWLKNGSPLVFNNKVLKLRGKVYLHNVDESDAGVYTCTVSDIQGNQVASISTQVTVLLHGLNGLECGTVTSPEVLNATEERALSGRIVGGQDALRGSAPWMARLYVRGRGHLCGGSLIDRQWVVTAAHCFHGEDPPAKEDLSIRLGDHGVLDTEQSEMLIPVEVIHEHEKFNIRTFDNDIALIKLLNPIRHYNDYIRPICLANRTRDRNLMTVGNPGRVNGWGRLFEEGITPEYLTEVNIPLVDYRHCKRIFLKSMLTFTRNMFCAGHSRGGSDACQGDSGGPYSVKDDMGRWHLTGIVSWGQGCGQAGQYGVYTRYSKYHSWVQSTINMLE